MNQTENVMGTRKIFPLLISMSIPPIISMMIQALYNIVDSMYVARVSEDALTAVSLAYPLQNLVIAVSVGCGIGLNACIARSLGAKNKKEAESTVTHGFILTALHSLLFILLGIFFTKPFLHMFTDDPQIFSMSCEYTRIVIIGAFGCIFHIYSEKVFQSVGEMVIPMMLQVFGAAFNIILDPILIFGFLGFPAMGVRGAAIATVLAEILAGGISLLVYAKKCKEVRLRFKGFHFDNRIVKKIYSIAVPSAIMISMPSLLVGALNSVLAGFSATAIAVFGLYIKVQSFVYMPANGVIQGMRPIMSYNYGAGNRKRMLETFKCSMWVSGVIIALGMCLLLFAPTFIMRLFDANEEMLRIGVPMLQIISLGFIPSTAGCVICGCFESLGKGPLSLLISLLRQLIIIVPFAYIFKNIWGIYGVWFTFPMAEILAAFVGIWLFVRFWKKLTI